MFTTIKLRSWLKKPKQFSFFQITEISLLVLLTSSCSLSRNSASAPSSEPDNPQILAGVIPLPTSEPKAAYSTDSLGDGGFIAPVTSDPDIDVGYVGTPAKLVISPSAYNFQAQSLRSITRVTFTITNTGGQFATGVNATGLSAPYSFSGGAFPGIKGSCSNTLAPSASCTMVVTFSPQSVGRFTLNNFALQSNAGALAIPLDGGGTDIATLHISNEVDDNSYYDFGTIAYGAALKKKFLVQYWGAVRATGVNFSGLSGAYRITSNACGTEIDHDCEIEVTYSGSLAGATQQKLKVVYNNSAFAAEADHLMMGTTSLQITPATLTITDGTTSHDFGRQLLGRSTQRMFTVVKGGSLPATNVSPAAFTNLAYSYRGGSYPGIGGTCGATITATCTIAVTFAPSVLGVAIDSIHLGYYDGQVMRDAALAIRGTGAQPSVLSFTPVIGQDFGIVPVNRSIDMGFTATNDSGSITAVNLQVGGATLPFKILNNCSTQLNPGSSCTTTIRFTPTQIGQSTGTITLTYFDGIQVQNITMPIQGTGDGGAVLQFTHSGVDFGGITIGSEQIIEVDVNYYGVQSGGHCVTSGVGNTPPSGDGSGSPFYFPGGSYPGTGGTCLQQINSPCKIYIAFVPVVTTTTSTTFTIFYDNGQGQPLSTSIQLSGHGINAIPASLSFSSPSLNFGSQVTNTSSTQTITVRRSGDLSATNVMALPLSAPFQFAGGSYPGTGGTCGATIPNSVSSCTMVVKFNPTAAGTFGPQTLNLTYSTGVATAQALLDLNGTAVDAAAIQASAVHFGNVAINHSATATLTLSNVGTRSADNLVGNALAITAPLSITGNHCPSSLPSGSSCSIDLSFSPVRPGLSTVTFPWTYQNGLGQTNLNIGIDGMGTVPLLVSANGNHTCARLIDGTVKCWGENNYGQLGQGDLVNRGDSTVAGHQMGANLTPVALGSGRYAIAISSGYFHSCVVLDDSSVKCWGDNEYGQLGLGSTVSSLGGSANQMGNSLSPVALGSGERAIDVVAGYAHTCALLQGGSVKCWGFNGEGQLGLGDKVNRGTQAADMGNYLAAVDVGGWGVKQIAAGTGHTCALLVNGTAKCWGNNLYGQLGQGDFMNRGDDPSELGNALNAIDLGSHLISHVTVGGGFSCALLDNGKVKCWGRNEEGILGIAWCQDIQGNLGLCSDSNYPLAVRGYGVNPDQMGDNLPTISLGTGRTVLSLGSADSSSCALLDNGTIKCWGANDAGQLGLGNTTSVGTSPSQMGDALTAVSLGSVVPTDISVGGSHACVTLAPANIKCWGDNHFGQLGIGDTGNRGDNPNEMGAALPLVSLP